MDFRSFISLLFRREKPSKESVKAIQEGNEFLAAGKKGRFTDGKSLIEAALK